MNLPQKIKEEVVEWRNGEPFTVKNLLPVENKVNEIIDYLESQQCSPFECPGTRQEEPKYTCKDFYKVHEGPCVNCVPKEEPKQVDVDGLLREYANLVIKNQDMPVTNREIEITNTLRSGGRCSYRTFLNMEHKRHSTWFSWSLT